MPQWWKVDLGKNYHMLLLSYIIDAVKKVQRCMQDYISECGIAIECNPSSNVLISNFERYDKHPILNMYNSGIQGEFKLETVRDYEQLLNFNIMRNNALSDIVKDSKGLTLTYDVSNSKKSILKQVISKRLPALICLKISKHRL